MLVASAGGCVPGAGALLPGIARRRSAQTGGSTPAAKGRHRSFQESFISHQDEEEKGFSKSPRGCPAKERSQEQPGKTSGGQGHQPGKTSGGQGHQPERACMPQCCRN